METGEMSSSKSTKSLTFNPSNCIRIYFFSVDIARLDSLLRNTKRGLGYWLICSDRNGGYAFAKIDSSGKSVQLKLLKFIMLQKKIQLSLKTVFGRNGVVLMETYKKQIAPLQEVLANGRLLLNAIKFLITFEVDFSSFCCVK